ncbi:MAG: glycine/D-amino acid oxidase-like deaminating enzyme [Gammaproteobacteria bacterium]|jgi:glycine/D-amino acid oxidase-like deaminating enzyme
MATALTMTKVIVVVGAGIVGVSTAIWLRRAGHDVTLIDKGAPGMGASYGNAGLLAQWAVVPVTTPKLWRDAPRYLMDRNSPLFVKWGHVPRMLPWLAQYMRNATDKRTRRIVNSLSPLLLDAVDQHRSLIQGTPVENWVRDSKMTFVYRDRTGFDADAYGWHLKAHVGLTPTVITGQAVQEIEPILSADHQCIAVLEGQGHVTDPGQYVASLALYFETLGGRVVRAEVQDLQKGPDGQITCVETDQDRFDCDAAVITAGIWSKELTRKLGLRIPLEAERGYHVIFENPTQTPRNPMMMVDGKFGVNAMDMGLRCAGTVELGDHHAGPSTAPFALLKKHATAAFPHMTFSGTQEWMGFRPSTPDSLPLIGELGSSGVFVGFGHQHIGLTAGPKTGRILAQIIGGQHSNLDLSAFDPARFSR